MAEPIQSGVELMIIGMGIVYLFLTMLVLVIYAMSAIVQRFFPEAKPTIIPAQSIASSASDRQTIAAITAAVHQYREKHNIRD